MKKFKLISIIFFAIIMTNSIKSLAQFTLLPDKNDPTISIEIYFKTGAQNDPIGKAGLASLTSSLMAEGSIKGMSYDNILAKLYPIASYYSVSCDKDMIVFSGRAPKEKFLEFYDIFKNVILNPAFDENDFNRVKSKKIDYIEKELRYSSDEELGKAALYNYIFKNTSYSAINEGTVSNLKSLTLDDVKKFYQTHFLRNNFEIALGGGFSENLAMKIANDIAELPQGEAPIIAKPNPEKINGLNVEIIDKDCDATAISIGYPIDVLRGDDDFFALALFTSWFGEHRNSSSHLYQVIREKRGLNYGDYAYIEHFANGGSYQMPPAHNCRKQSIFEIWLRPVENSKRHFTLRAALRELKDVVDNGMTKEDFELTKQFLNKYALHYAPTLESKLAWELDGKFFGIKDDYIELFRKKIGSLTLEQVNNAIKKYIQYDNLKIAIVTKDGESLKNDLISNKPSAITYSTPKPKEVLDEDKLIEKFPLNIKSENITIVPVDKMFE